MKSILAIYTLNDNKSSARTISNMKRPFYPGVITKDSISYFVALQGVESVSDDRVV